MIGAAGTVVLPHRVVPQPTPEINPGGDCGACVMGGILGRSPEYVYDVLKGERKPISHHEMRRILRVASLRGDIDRAVEEPAQWRSGGGQGFAAFGFPAWIESLPWFQHVRMAIDAGYYGIAEVDMARTGGRKYGGTNHWVMICGARTDGASTPHGKIYTGEILVSCSARVTAMQEEWVEAREFLELRGGYNLLFARPTR